MRLDAREIATVRAALRLWQAYVSDSEYFPELPADLGTIATNVDCIKPMNIEEIDELCEKLCQDDSDTLLHDIGSWTSEIKAGGCIDWRAESILNNVRILLS